MGCAGFLRKCFIRISASGGPAADMGTAFSALPDLFTGFHQLTSFCHFSSDFGVGVLSFFIQAWEYAGNF